MRKLLLLVILLAPSILVAAPGKPVIGSALTHGSSVTITGTGFGTKDTPAPAIWDKVEGTYTTTITDGGIVPVRTAFSGGPQEATAPFQFNSDGYNHTVFDNEASNQRHVRSSACYTDDKVAGGYRGYLGNGEDFPILGASTSITYISWWIKTGTDWADYNGGGTSNKFLRMRDVNYDDGPANTFTWQNTQSYIYQPADADCGGTIQCSSSTPWSSGWHFLEGIFDNENQTYTLRIDNTDVCTNAAWACPFNFNTIHKWGWDANATVLDVWFDELYFDRTASRVMLGNASTYSGCTHLEVQPPTAWNENGQAITVTFNQGSFEDGDTVYFYVIDSDGAVSPASDAYVLGSPAPAPPTLSNVTISNGSFR